MKRNVLIWNVVGALYIFYQIVSNIFFIKMVDKNFHDVVDDVDNQQHKYFTLFIQGGIFIRIVLIGASIMIQKIANSYDPINSCGPENSIKIYRIMLLSLIIISILGIILFAFLFLGNIILHGLIPVESLELTHEGIENFISISTNVEVISLAFGIFSIIFLTPICFIAYKINKVTHENVSNSNSNSDNDHSVSSYQPVVIY